MYPEVLREASTTAVKVTALPDLTTEVGWVTKPKAEVKTLLLYNKYHTYIYMYDIYCIYTYVVHYTKYITLIYYIKYSSKEEFYF